ncbi:MAG: tetratricopeptide repeat protein [Rhodothermales bacterium]
MRAWIGNGCIVGLLAAWCAVAGCGQHPAREAVRQGDAAFDAMEFQQALDHYNRALAADSTMAEAYLGRGKIYWLNNQHDLAAPDLDRAIAFRPDLMWAYYYRGVSRMMLRQFEEGIDDLATATASGVLPAEDLARAHRFRGIGLMNLERYEEAVADISSGIAAQPEWPPLYLDRAQLYEALNQPAQALADYETYLSFAREETDRTAALREKLAALRAALGQ